MVEVICDNCGKTFNRKKSQVQRCENHFCCKNCKADFKIKETYKKLSDLVGMDFKDFLYEKYVNELMTVRQISLLLYENVKKTAIVLDWLHKYDIPIRHGSEAIKVQWINNDERRKKTSERAKKNLKNEESKKRALEAMSDPEYKLKMSLLKRGSKNPMYGKRGSKHHNYNPNLTDEERKIKRNTLEDKAFRLNVFERDNFTCRKCGDNHGGNLQAHHILNHWKYKDLRYDVNNGITLCKKCHTEFHKEFGYKENNLEQLILWLKTNKNLLL